MTADDDIGDIDGLCGDGTCRARVIVRLLLPDDPLVSDPCPRCAAAATAALSARQEAALEEGA